MKTFTYSVLVFLLLCIAAPAYSDSKSLAVQVFVCDFGEDTIEEQVLEMASVWLEAAKKLPGGKNMEVAVRFPVAEGPSEGDFVFYFITPTFAEWGAFTDAYEGSAASEVDDKYEDLVECGDSTIWEGHRIK